MQGKRRRRRRGRRKSKGENPVVSVVSTGNRAYKPNL